MSDTINLQPAEPDHRGRYTVEQKRALLAEAEQPTESVARRARTIHTSTIGQPWGGSSHLRVDADRIFDRYQPDDKLGATLLITSAALVLVHMRFASLTSILRSPRPSGSLGIHSACH